MRLLPVVTVIGVALAGCGDKKLAKGPGQKVPGKPVETGESNAPDQKPAFAGQTRAPFMTANVKFETKTIAKGLEHPWSVAFMKDGTMLVTERPGRLRIISKDGQMSPAVVGVPPVDKRDQGGLLDVIVDPQQDNVIYLSYAEPRGDKNGTAVARATLVRENPPRLDDVKVIFRMKPDLDSTKHYGSRFVFARDGKLFVALGERSIEEGRKQAQRLDSHFGKVIRINTDGSVPNDNPFVGKENALPEIWSIGHRNIQSAALHPDTGELWVVEHGTRGGDEVNVAERGKDYGWPTIAYGVEYRGDKIGEGITQKEGMEQPLYYWDPVIAPSGMVFYTGDMFPAWKGSLFVGGLAGKHIARLTLDGRKVVGEERLLPDRARIRDVRQGPDGSLYVLTDEDEGELLQLTASDATSGQSTRR